MTTRRVLRALAHKPVGCPCCVVRDMPPPDHETAYLMALLECMLTSPRLLVGQLCEEHARAWRTIRDVAITHGLRTSARPEQPR